MATIKDVAKLAGVSVATVSRVVNKNGYVKNSTYDKVKKAIDALDYKPDALAISLNNKKTKTLGLILPDITNPFFPELAKAVETIANKNGYTMILCNTSGDTKNEIKQIDMLESKYVDGIILASNTFEEDKYEHINLPLVLLDRGANSNYSTITGKNMDGAVMATNHLLEQGCNKVGHLAGPSEILTAQQRLEGYKSVVKQLDWFNDDLIAYANYRTGPAIAATKRLLELNPDIDGIFAGNDLMAVGCLKALNSLGYMVPEDIMVIGYDGISLTELMIPEISTIKQPIYQMGTKATEQIIKEIEEGKNKSSFIEFDVSLIQRESTNRKRRAT